MTRDPRRHAFTLIETVVSLTISSVLLMGIGSSIMLASRALPGDDSLIAANARTTTIAHTLTTELSTALTVTQADPSTIAFTVPDRDNNGSSETIRYAWSGTPGAPLTRRYNSNPISLIANTLDDFNLTYDLDNPDPGASTTEELPFTTIVSISIDATTPEDGFAITATSFCGEYFQPDPALLPADATRWKVDRVRFHAKSNGSATGTITVELHLPNADRTPQGAILDSCTVAEGSLAKNSWTRSSCDLTNAPWVNVSDGMTVVLATPSGSSGSAGLVLNQTMSAPVSAYASFLSYDSLSVYAVDSTRSLTGFDVFATVEVDSSTAGGVTLKRVKLSMRATADPNGQIETGVEMLNHPAAP